MEELEKCGIEGCEAGRRPSRRAPARLAPLNSASHHDCGDWGDVAGSGIVRESDTTAQTMEAMTNKPPNNQSAAEADACTMPKNGAKSKMSPTRSNAQKTQFISSPPKV